MNPHSGVVMLYDGPEHRGEGQLSGKHPDNRLMRRVAVALAAYEGETRRGVKSQGAARGIQVHGGGRGADISGFIYMTGRRRAVGQRDFAVYVWDCDILFVFGPEFLQFHLAAMWPLLQTLVSGEQGAPLTFTKLCPPVLEPHLLRKQRRLAKVYGSCTGQLENV